MSNLTSIATASREVLIERGTAVVAATGSGTAIAFGLTANECAALVGALVAVIGVIANVAVVIYYKHQHLVLAREALRTGHAQITMDGD
jgi:hypothetical protein